MIIILLGPPGAGKGTQAKKICESKKLFHFSTGDILRNEVKQKSSIGKKIESIINAGKLVSDDIILDIVEKIISDEFSKNKGILFDGFPRNLDQANSFEKLLENACWIDSENSIFLEATAFTVGIFLINSSA